MAVAGSRLGPTVVARRRVELSRETPRQPFHAAESLPMPAAEDLVRRSTDETRRLAQGVLREAAAEIRSTGHELRVCGLLTAATRPLPGLREVLASHAFIHAAEGEHFRDALRRASLGCEIPVLSVRERDLEARAADVLGHPAAELRRQIAAWGKVLGPPWTQDEKGAALVAWLALAGAGADA